MPFSDEALTALAVAARDHAPIADLEFLGANKRTLSILEEHGIETMDKLLESKPEDLEMLKCIGPKSVRQVIDCLSNYHKLPEIMQDLDVVFSDAD